MPDNIIVLSFMLSCVVSDEEQSVVYVPGMIFYVKIWEAYFGP